MSTTEKRKHDAVESDSDDDYGPRPASAPAEVTELSAEEKAKLELQAKKEAQLAKLKALVAAYQERLPNAQMYEKSYMHRTPLTFTLYANKTDFLITASEDGVVKLWKKTATDIEFVKAFKAHAGPVVDGAVDAQGAFLATISTDNTVKIFSIEAFDLTATIELTFAPTAVAWLPARAQGGVLALGDAEGYIRLYSTAGAPLSHRQIHYSRVHLIRPHPTQTFALSADAKGHVEAWGSSAEGLAEYFDDPYARGFVTYSSKLSTGLAELCRLKARVMDLQLTPDGAHYAVHVMVERAVAAPLWKVTASSDTGLTTISAVLMVRTTTGQVLRRLIEDPDTYAAAHGSRTLPNGHLNPRPLDAVELGKRLAREREVERLCNQHWQRGYGFPTHTLALDVSGHFAFCACALGVRVWALGSGRPVSLLGLVEAEERFTSLAVFQGVPKATGAVTGGGARARLLLAGGAAPSEESCLFACAHKRPRVYIFSQREPQDEQRDVLNERLGGKPTSKPATSSLRAAKHVTLHTTLGDIRAELFPDAAPKTVHNFVSLCERQYYNGCPFHRVIKGFMVQTGDAERGDGSGGQSVFGRPFEDEISTLRHDRPGVLSMANAGPNTNGSQFFFTTVPTPHLDRKHTVFGRVVSGMDTLRAIEAVRTNPKNDRPLEPVKILTTTVEQ